MGRKEIIRSILFLGVCQEVLISKKMNSPWEYGP